MAGIGVRLNRIFEKNTLTTNLVGFFYSTVVTVAPMFVIIINLILMNICWFCQCGICDKRAVFLQRFFIPLSFLF